MSKPDQDHRNLRGKKGLKILTDYIQHEQETISILAWVGYQSVGRGIVMVVLDENGLNANYIHPEDELWSVLRIDDSEETLADVANYDPKTQVIVLQASEPFVQIVIYTPNVPPPVSFVKYQNGLS